MAPIKIHSDSPISPTAASSVTAPHPQTQPPARPFAPSNPTPTATQTFASTQYPPPRPGQAAVPAPTGLPEQRPPMTAGPNPTKTVPQESSDTAPPPQPGAAPRAAQNNPQSSYQPMPQQMTSPAVQPPPQASMPPPQSNFAPNKSTTTSYPPQSSFSTQTSEFQPSLSHPPGYSQNTGALEMSAAQRNFQEQQEQNGEGAGLFSTLNAQGTNFTGDGSGESAGEMVGNAWNAAKGWIGTVGSKLEGVENEVWKRVNNDK